LETISQFEKRHLHSQSKISHFEKICFHFRGEQQLWEKNTPGMPEGKRQPGGKVRQTGDQPANRIFGKNVETTYLTITFSV
jgi:hypothetical protein